MPSRVDIVEEARGWLGVRWQHQGRTRLGIDCAGLIEMVGRGLALVGAVSKPNYQRRTHGTDFLDNFKEHMLQKPVDKARPGDVLLFRDNQYPCHSAIVGERGDTMTIIHAYTLKRKVLEEPIGQGDWMDRRVACFEYKGVED